MTIPMTPDVPRLRAAVDDLLKAHDRYLVEWKRAALWGSDAPPDGAAKREARIRSVRKAPLSFHGIRDATEEMPTPAPTEAPAAGSAEEQLRKTGEAFRRWAREQSVDPTDDDLMQAFIAGTEHAAARPAAVTDAMADQIAERVTSGLPFNNYDVVTTTKRDLEQRVRAAALAARGPA